jgi:hypothetical protein
MNPGLWVLLALFVPMVTHAQEPPPMEEDKEPLHVVVRVQSSSMTVVLERVRGQVSDLDVRLSVREGPLEAGLDSQLSVVDPLGKELSAKAVIWFEEVEGGLRLVVAEPGTGRALITKVAGNANTGERNSAMQEGAALIIRGAIQALLAGTPISAPRPPPKVEKKEPIPPPPPPAPKVEERRRGEWVGTLGWQFVEDGYSSPGQHGVAAQLGLVMGTLELGISLSAGPGDTVAGALANVRLTRYAFAASVAYRRSLSSSAMVRVGARLGSAFFARTTESTMEGVTATASQVTTSPLLGVDASFLFRPSWAGRVGASLTAGTDYAVGSPELVYDTGGTEVSAGKVRALQPFGIIGLAIFLD